MPYPVMTSHLWLSGSESQGREMPFPKRATEPSPGLRMTTSQLHEKRRIATIPAHHLLRAKERLSIEPARRAASSPAEIHSFVRETLRRNVFTRGGGYGSFVRLPSGADAALGGGDGSVARKWISARKYGSRLAARDPRSKLVINSGFASEDKHNPVRRAAS